MKNNIINIKRVYEAPSENDGFRVLVDRLWPRGISKDKAQIDMWMKEIAPSNEIRKWFCHDPEKFPEFKQQYIHFLYTDVEANRLLRELHSKMSGNLPITLVYAAKDEIHNQAIVLKEVLLTMGK